MPAVYIAPDISIDVLDAPWNEFDRAAWYWPDPIKPADWIEKYIRLARTSIPGPFRFYNAPYLRGIANVTSIPGVARLVVRKVVQAGVSELFRALMCYWAHTDPGPTGLTLPNEKKGHEIVENDVIPSFKAAFGEDNVAAHPELSGMLTGRPHDIKRGTIKLANSFIMHLMWSGSPASMASNPMTRAISDEADKFERWAGNDADPISLVDARLTTATNPLHAIISTPTVDTGEISTNFANCRHQLYFLVPCPHCGARQRLIFGDGGGFGVTWSEPVRALQKAHEFIAAAAAVLEDGQCWYQCHSCRGKFDERAKRLAVREGKWGTVGSDLVTPDGRIDDVEQVANFPAGTWLGMQVDGELLMWRTMAQQAADFLRARTYQQQFFFRTSRQGLPWEEISATKHTVSIESAARDVTLPEGVLPWWTSRVVAVIDTQQTHFWVVIRAWGAGMRSHRVWHGRLESFHDLDRICFGTPFKNEDMRLPPRICDMAVIDSGGGKAREGIEETDTGPAPSRVMEVYRWCLANVARVRAIKGDSRPKPGIFIRRGQGIYTADKQTIKLPIMLLDTQHFQDYLVDLMGRRIGQPEEDAGKPAWRLNTRDDPEYLKHMSNLHKVRRGMGDETEWRWEPVREGARVDYRACEGYMVAAAEMLQIPILPELGAWKKLMEAQLRSQAEPPPRVPITDNQFSRPDGQAYLSTERN